MENKITFIGFGEAASAFAAARSRSVRAFAYDLKTDLPGERPRKLEDYAHAEVTGCETARTALAEAQVVLSLVTADQALSAAQIYAPLLAPGTLWLDMNSVAPETKRAAARAIEAAGGLYADVAVMAPVHPARLGVPLLVSGSNAQAAAEALRAIGFTNIQTLPGGVGAASAVKMIRSVMVKGIEALTSECLMAAEAAGVTDAVLASLDASARGGSWTDKADYNLDRMIVHGTRRAAEMEEVVKTLSALGTGAVMSKGTVQRQRQIGALGLAPPKGLKAKLAALLDQRKEAAA